jgi:hypothetical protein
MKGINAKKIAAFAGTALLFGAAAVAAEVTYGSTQLVDQSGQPTVKIYVGSKAQISDGVAAANIAAKIANEAYKSSTLTATVSGTPTCTVGSGVSGAGSCSIVESSKKVTLEVTLPGTVAGTYTFKTLITDTIDRTLANRNYTLSEDMYNSSTTSTDTSGTITSPLRAVDTSNKGKLLYRIGSGQFNGFADYAVADNQATAVTYTEEQSFWVGSQTDAVKYDESSSIRDVAVNKYSAMVYSAKFTGNDYGIQVCTGDLNSTDTTNWASCASDSNSRTDRHRVTIQFMGAEWIISEMTNPTASHASSTSVAAGGQIKLAKEAKYGIINVGGELDAGVFKIRLSDISVAVGAANTHPAIIDVLDANDAVVGQIQVDPGTTYTFTQSGTGNQVKIHVYKTAPGFTLNAKWAEMAIYTDEITLKDAQRYNLVSSTDTNKDFKVSLLWKNRDWSSNADSNTSDSLREIVIYNIDGFSDKTKAGDVVNFLKGTPTYKVTYQGVDLADDNYAPITYSALSSDGYRVAIADGDVACQSTSSGDITYTAKLIEIKTSGVQLLGGTGDALSGDYLLDKVMFDPVGTVSHTSTGGINGTQNQSVLNANRSPKVFWKVSGRDCWNWNNVTYDNPAITNAVKLDAAGDNSAAQGEIYFNSSLSTSAGAVSGYQAYIMLQEDAGKFGDNSNFKVLTAVPVIVNDTSYQTFRFRASDSSTQQVYYRGLRASPLVFTNYEPTLVTERGTKVLSVGTSDASLKVAKKVGMPTFQFAYADTSSAAASADQYVMGVGESKVFGGVTVKVKAIDATCGSCSVLGAGGTPGCTVDSSGVSGVISPDNAASVQVSQPYKLTSSMVMLDSQAMSGVAITVGGPLVNTVTKEALADSNVNFDVDNVVVKEIGNKIVVAGKTAADTMTAADQFIAGVKRQ